MSDIFNQDDSDECVESLFEETTPSGGIFNNLEAPEIGQEGQPSKKELKKLAKQQKKEAKQLAKQQKKQRSQAMPQQESEDLFEQDNSWLNEIQDEPQQTETHEEFYQAPYEEQVEDFVESVQDDIEKPKKAKKIKQPKQSKSEKQHKQPKKAKKRLYISINPKPVATKCTEPRFRKEDIHRQSTPYLDIDDLHLNQNSSPLYMDELKELEERETYIPEEETFDVPYVEPIEPTFNTEDFLSGITPVIEEPSIDEPTDYTLSNELDLPDMEDIKFEPVEELLPEPIEESIPEPVEYIPQPVKPTLEIKDTDINLEECILDLGAGTTVNKEQTSITFNKESLAHIAERIR